MKNLKRLKHLAHRKNAEEAAESVPNLDLRAVVRRLNRFRNLEKVVSISASASQQEADQLYKESQAFAELWHELMRLMKKEGR